MRRTFAERDCVVLPGLFAPELIDRVHAEMDRATFDARDYDGLAGELTLDHATPIVARLLFLLNDPTLYRTIERIADVGPIQRYDGRIYRRMPVAEHYDNWHDDLGVPERLVTMSVNLGPHSYGGGVLQLRHAGADDLLAEVHNTGVGDALLFRLGTGLEHRVTGIESGVKTALAGWFASGPPWPLPIGLGSGDHQAKGNHGRA